jgi:hypothetical protein
MHRIVAAFTAEQREGLVLVYPVEASLGVQPAAQA